MVPETRPASEFQPTWSPTLKRGVSDLPDLMSAMIWSHCRKLRHLRFHGSSPPPRGRPEGGWVRCVGPSNPSHQRYALGLRPPTLKGGLETFHRRTVSDLRKHRGRPRTALPVPSRNRAVHDLLGFGEDRVEVLPVAKALRVDLVDVLGSRWPCREPAVFRDDLDAADRRTVAGRLVE